MNEQQIENLYQTIVKLLSQRSLKEAIIQLSAILQSEADWDLNSQLEQIRLSYQYMLQYMRDGIADPQRDTLFQQLLRNAWKIADQIRKRQLTKHSNRYYYQLTNKKQLYSEDNRLSKLLTSLENFQDDLSISELTSDNKESVLNVLTNHEAILRKLFLTVWTNSDWTQEDFSEGESFLTSKTLLADDLALFVSAVTLSVMECFDERKLQWLMIAYNHSDVHVSQRALVAIAIAFHQYEHRLLFYPSILATLSYLNENHQFASQLNQIQIQILHSQETEAIDKKMREDILPEMMKHLHIGPYQKFGLEDMNEDIDQNPEWKIDFDKQPSAQFDKKVEEMQELLSEGADIYFSTFSGMKSHPFFSEIQNWFLPFSMKQSTVYQAFGDRLNNENLGLASMLQSGFFCNSDQYSFCLMMSMIPREQQNRVLSQMASKEDLSEMLDKDNLSMIAELSKKPDVVSNQYIHDLYRFCKLYQRKSEFHDLFNDKWNLIENRLLEEILEQTELMKATGNFYFQHLYFKEAFHLYNKLIENEQADAELYQKAGFCLQKQKEYEMAIDFFKKADILKPDHIWTLNHLATCHRMLQHYDSAFAYYHRIHEMRPENTNIIFYQGTCLAAQEKYEEALQYFFRIDLMEESSMKAWRAIAWCSFLINKFEQANKYYTKILSGKELLTSDFMNAGHVALVSGNLNTAIELYNKAAAKQGNFSEFKELFYQDRDVLIKKGISETDLSLILDLL